ncbi:MAG: pyroglutamyl-peptidase I [Sulfuriferula sp.]
MKHNKAILVTGFEPNDDGLNASKILVESLRDDPPDTLLSISQPVHYLILPSSTSQLRTVILEHISRYKPAYCIFTGQAPGRNKVTLERLATNLKDFGSPDGEGNQPHGDCIEADGNAAYWSNLPHQERLVERLNDNGIPAAFSNHGGNHLCNQIFYHGLHHAHTEGLNLKCGFMHIPALPIQAQKQWLATPFIPLSMARDALALVLAALADIAQIDLIQTSADSTHVD